MEAEPEHWLPAGVPRERRDGKKAVKLPETPKTAEEMWQHSVIGDYLAKYRVRTAPSRPPRVPVSPPARPQQSDRRKAQVGMEAAWKSMEKKEKIPWIKKAAEDQKRYEVCCERPAVNAPPPRLCCNSGGVPQRELLEMRTLPAGQSQRKHKFDGEPKKPPV